MSKYNWRNLKLKRQIRNWIRTYKMAGLCYLIAFIIGVIFLPTNSNASKETNLDVIDAPIVEVAEETPQIIEEEPEIVVDNYKYEPRSDEYYYEVDLLARLIHCENSNEVDGEEACWKTGSVVVNRINNTQYPDTLEGVIYEKGQYDCTSKLYKITPTDIEYEVAAELINSGSVIPENVVFAAEFYQGSGRYDSEGKTIYCYQ